jgi:hypothetical protein
MRFYRRHAQKPIERGKKLQEGGAKIPMSNGRESANYADYEEE